MNKKTICLCFLLFCAAAFPQDVRDIIQPMKLNPGNKDTVLMSDVFYAKDYSLTFAKHSNIHIEYNRETRQAVFSADKDFTGFSLLDFNLNGRQYSLPVYSGAASSILVKHTFRYRTDTKPNSIAIVGSFNGWDKNKNPMKVEKSTGEYYCDILLKPGSHVYKISIDGQEILDPINPERAPTGFETFNSVLRIPESKSQRNYLHIWSYREHEGKVLLRFLYERENQAEELSCADVLALLDNTRISQKQIKVTGKEIELQFSAKQLSGEKLVRLAVVQNGLSTNFQTVFLRDAKPLKQGGGRFSWYDASVYSIMVDRFDDGDRENSIPVKHDSLFPQANYFGGDFQGIINKIDDGYFSALGVNVIWLSPVYDNPPVAFREYPKPYRWYSGYHGYWPVSQNRVEEKFGTMTKLKELVSKAHKKNIRILLDIVAHHVHIDNPLFKEKPDWFGTLDLPDGRKNLRLWDEYRLTTWFEPYMPSFDYTRSMEPVKYMADNCIWWLKETGADGFRHDAVKHVPNLFWRHLTRELKERVEIPSGRTVYQIGETFGDYDLIGSYVNNGQLSGQFNFNLSYLAIPVFLEKKQTFGTLDFHMKKSFGAYGVNHLMGNIMDSHDKIRFMAYADGDVGEQGVDTREMAWKNPPTVDNASSYKKAELYYAYMFTIPGMPYVYYGSEFGMTGADDPDNRRMMRFGDALNENERMMLNVTSKIVKLRNDHPALRYGDFQTLLADQTFYSYLRTDLNEQLLIVLSKSENDEKVKIPFEAVLKADTFTDVLTGERLKVADGTLTVNLEQYGWRVLKRTP